jgi:hypothetical protein
MGLVHYDSDSDSESAPALDKQHGKRPEPDGSGDSHRDREEQEQEQEQVTTKPSTLLLSAALRGVAITDESAGDELCRVFPERLLQVSTSMMSLNIQHEESHRHLKIGSQRGRNGSVRAMLMCMIAQAIRMTRRSTKAGHDPDRSSRGSTMRICTSPVSRYRHPAILSGLAVRAA